LEVRKNTCGYEFFNTYEKMTRGMKTQILWYEKNVGLFENVVAHLIPYGMKFSTVFS
jgi:hypothetical protein